MSIYFRSAVNLFLIFFFSFVGVCCPDDIVSPGAAGSSILVDLPAGGHDYPDNATNTGMIYIFFYYS